MKANKTSRRDAIQQIGLFSGALCLLPLASCGHQKKEQKINAATTKAPTFFNTSKGSAGNWTSWE